MSVKGFNFGDTVHKYDYESLENNIDKSSIAPVYDPTKTYAVGDYSMHDGFFYECNTPISTPEAWTAAHWSKTSVGDEVSDLKEDLNEIESKLETDFVKVDTNGRFYV